MLGNIEWLNDVRADAVNIMLRVVPKFFKKHTLKDVPASISPRLTQFVGKSFQLPEIVGLHLHQGRVVSDKALNKGVIIGVLAFLESPVYK